MGVPIPCMKSYFGALYSFPNVTLRKKKWQVAIKSEDSTQTMIALKLDHINNGWSQWIMVCGHNMSHLYMSEAFIRIWSTYMIHHVRSRKKCKSDGKAESAQQEEKLFQMIILKLLKLEVSIPTLQVSWKVLNMLSIRLKILLNHFTNWFLSHFQLQVYDFYLS